MRVRMSVHMYVHSLRSCPRAVRMCVCASVCALCLALHWPAAMRRSVCAVKTGLLADQAEDRSS